MAKPKKREQPPDLDKEDEEILDRVWDEEGEEQDKGKGEKSPKGK